MRIGQIADVCAVRARGITKSFGDVIALDGVDLDVAAGQIHGLVGPNGAGKTTLLGLLLGLAVRGRAAASRSWARRSGRALAVPDGVAGFVDGPGLYPSLTARRNLAALAALRGPGAPTAGIDDALEQVGLTDVADDRVRGFSLGMRQRLGLAAALLTKPRLLVLDEPANGLDPAGKRARAPGPQPACRGRGRGGAVQPPDGRPRGAVLRGHHPRHRAGRLLRPAEQARRRDGELDYRLRTSDADAARRLAADAAGLRVPVDDAAAAAGPRGARGPRAACPPSTNWCRGWFGRASRCASWRRSCRRSRPRSSPSPSGR